LLTILLALVVIAPPAAAQKVIREEPVTLRVFHETFRHISPIHMQMLHSAFQSAEQKPALFAAHDLVNHVDAAGLDLGFLYTNRSWTPIVEPQAPATKSQYDRLVSADLGRPATEMGIADTFQRIQRRDRVVQRATVLNEVTALDGYEEAAGYLSRSFHFEEKKANEVAAAFDHRAIVKVMHTDRPLSALRLYGGASPAVGHWYFCCLEDDRSADASGLALPKNNSSARLATVTLPAGTTLLAGTVADQDNTQFAGPGGNAQFYVPQLDVANTKYETFAASPGDRALPGDIVIQLDGGTTIRFHPEHSTIPSFAPSTFGWRAHDTDNASSDDGGGGAAAAPPTTSPSRSHLQSEWCAYNFKPVAKLAKPIVTAPLSVGQPSISLECYGDYSGCLVHIDSEKQYCAQSGL
jgi:hypothetical protein